MAFPGWPLDLSFTQWSTVAAGSRKPGYSDVDKWSAATINLANKPTAKWQNTNSVLVGTTPALTLLPVNFTTKIWQTETGMTVANSFGSPGSATYKTDRLFLTQPGEWEFGCMVSSLTNNNVGICYLVLSLIFADNSGETEYDFDKDVNTTLFASKLKVSASAVVNATQVSNGIGVRARYAQNSGGTNTLNSTDPAWPNLWARWVSKGGQ